MFQSIIRLVAITFGVVILTVFAVLFVRWTGSHQEFQKPPHTWFEWPRWTVEMVDREEVCAAPVLGRLPGQIVMIKVSRKEGEWVVPCKTPVPLAVVLERSAQADWLIEVDASETPDLDKFVEIVGKFDKQKKFAVFAPAQKVARFLRQRAPQWLFAADSASLLRLHLFESLYLEPAMDFWPDFVISSFNREDGTRLSAREAAELHRRQKRILWREIPKHEMIQPDYPVDGTVRSVE